MAIDKEIESAAAAIREGRLVAFPTETVYGLGANGLDPVAVAGIFELKQRPRFNPLILHIASVDTLTDLATSVPQQAADLIARFWPGPLTLVLEKRNNVPDIVTAGLPSVAVRFPANSVAQRLIQASGLPLAAPSANRFGKVSPTTAGHVLDQFNDQSLVVLDDGPCQIGVESTVISFEANRSGRATLLRHGGVTQEELEAVVGPIETVTMEETRPTSPGQLSRHYSPTTPLIISATDHVSSNEAVGLLTFEPPVNEGNRRFAAIEVLSEQGSLREAAANLFAAMRRLDALGLDRIIARPVPETGLGRAIMDRLRRAAAS